MENVIVRAVTYFTKTIHNLDQAINELENGISTLEDIEKTLVDHKYEVFTKRISFPGLDYDIASKLIDRIPRGVLVSAGYMRNRDLSKLIELAMQGMYTPILHTGEPEVELAKRYSEIIHRISELDPEAATRVAIGIHDENFMSPYFPDSSSRGDRVIGLAFIYSHLLTSGLKNRLSLNDIFRDIFSEIEIVVNTVRGKTMIPVFVDYSLSPWMDKSVAEIYETLDCSLIDGCVLYYTWLLNKTIREHSNMSTRTGFNEVMLPYAEDNLLIDYGRKGLLRARDFLLYSSTCVAGVDMVVVPSDVNKLAHLIASTIALGFVKNKPIALRAIPVSSDPGDVVDLGRFGKVPVIDY